MKDNERVVLYSVIALLAGIIVFAATFIVPIRSGVLQHISGGTIIIATMFLLSIGIKKAKEKREEDKFSKIVEEENKKTRSPLDASYFSSSKGNYYNTGSICTQKVVGIKFSFKHILEVIDAYAEVAEHNNYIIYLRTTELLGADRENEIRSCVKGIGGKVVIIKDISSINVPDGVYDINIVIAKVTLVGLKTLLNCFKHEDLAIINICDDYNAAVFSSEDTHMAFSENYRFKFFANRKYSECILDIRYGTITNTERFIEQIIEPIIDRRKNRN